MDDDDIAAEGTHFAEARTGDIVVDFGEAVLELSVSSPNGGKLSFQIQTFIQAPHEDLVLKIDDVDVSVVINSMTQWKKEEFEIKAGEHSIKWVHRKNPSRMSDEVLAEAEHDLGISRIDDVIFSPY